MSKTKKRKLRGRIIVVQEDRFRIAGDSGTGCLLTLSHKAGTNQEDLKRFRDAGTEVDVEYEGEPNLASGVALSVEPFRSFKETSSSAG